MWFLIHYKKNLYIVNLKVLIDNEEVSIMNLENIFQEVLVLFEIYVQIVVNLKVVNYGKNLQNHII